jgi:hypothetical protein
MKLKLVVATLALGFGAAPALTQAQDRGGALMTADHALEEAVAARDSAVLEQLLDEDLAWTDANGRAFSKTQVLRTPPAILIVDPADEERIYHRYGVVGAIQVHQGRSHAVHVWVQRPSGWRLLAYQEVRSLDNSPTVTPGAGETCENPCKHVGMEPQNAVQAAVIAAYQELEVAAETHDVPLWSRRIADEFIAASSNSDRLFDKPSRIAGLRRSTMRGLSPTPLVWGHIYDFTQVAVMLSEHVPDRGAPLRVTRLWVHRDGEWVEALSYQTAVVQDANIP